MASLIVIATLIILFFVLCLLLFVLMYQKNILKKDQEIKAIGQRKQIELFDASAQAEEREKERIARNLHDEINPMLTVLKQNLQKHKFDLLKNKFDVSYFELHYDLIEKITEGITASSYELVPSFMIKYGLIISLEDYLRSLNAGEKIKALFKLNSRQPAQELPFSKSEQLNIYRMSLEIINNILKHSSCRTLDLHLSVLENGMHIRIDHNGTGIGNDEIDLLIATGKGLGLKSLYARALILNAEINYIKNLPVSQVHLTIPYRL